MIQFDQKGILFAVDIEYDVILHIHHKNIPVVEVALPKSNNKLNDKSKTVAERISRKKTCMNKI